MMDSVVIELAGAPVGKGRPRFARAGAHVRTFTPAATRSYEDALRYAAQVAMAGRAPIDGPVTLEMTAAFPIPKSFSKAKREAAIAGSLRPTKKPDCDNILKVVDSLNQVVWCDDAQVVNAMVRKVYSERAALTITVWGAR